MAIGGGSLNRFRCAGEPATARRWVSLISPQQNRGTKTTIGRQAGIIVIKSTISKNLLIVTDPLFLHLETFLPLQEGSESVAGEFICGAAGASNKERRAIRGARRGREGLAVRLLSL